jgi:hypothetical protein
MFRGRLVYVDIKTLSGGAKITSKPSAFSSTLQSFGINRPSASGFNNFKNHIMM